MKLNLRFNRVIIDKQLLPQVRITEDIQKLDQSLCCYGEIAQLFVKIKQEFDCYHLQNARYFKHAFAFSIPGSSKTIGFSGYMVYALDWNDKIQTCRYESLGKKTKNIAGELIKFTNKSISIGATFSQGIPQASEFFSNHESPYNNLIIFYETIISSLKENICLPVQLELKPSWLDGENIVFSPQMDIPLGIFIRTKGYQRSFDTLEQEPTITIAQGKPLPSWIIRDNAFKNYLFNLIIKKFQENSADIIDIYQKLYLKFVHLLNSEVINFISTNQNQHTDKVSFSPISANMTSQAYNWFYANDPVKISRRIQAYQSYPLPITACISQNRTFLYKTIDRSAPLAEEISQLFNIPPHALKLAKEIPNHLNYAFLSVLDNQLRCNPVSKAKENHKASINTYKGLDRVQHKKCWPVKASKVSVEQQWLQFFSMIQIERNWTIQNTTVGIYSKYENVWKHMDKMLVSKPISEDDSIGVRDMINAFKQEIILPLFYDSYKKMGWLTYEFYSVNDILCKSNGDDNSILEKVLTGDMNPHEIIKLNHDWHMRREGINQIISSSNVSLNEIWQVLVPAQKFQGLDIIALISRAELNREGSELSHCVARYAETCRMGRSAIFTIRDNGKPVSTLELLVDQGKKQVSIAQNKSFRNATPEAKALDAGIWLRDQINTGSLRVNWHELSKQSKLARKQYHNRSIHNDIGYDPNDWLVREQLFNAWKPIMGKNIQPLSYAEWIEHFDLEQIIANSLANHYWNAGKIFYLYDKTLWLAKKLNIFRV